MPPKKTSPGFFDDFPSTPLEWSRAGVDQISLHDFDDFKSASKISEQQFLLLRALVRQHRINRFCTNNHNLQEKYDEATTLIRNSPDFDIYLQSIRDKTYDRSSKYYGLWRQQREVLSLSQNSEDKLKSVDETPINSTFMALLDGIASMFPTSSCTWRQTKVPLIADFSRFGHENRKYIAVTDGQLQDNTTGTIRALVECKKAKRVSASPGVVMQVAAQLVAWIKEYPGPERQRVVVEQDGSEIHVTFANYTDGFVEYLNTGRSDSSSFMFVNTYGPYFIDNHQHVLCVAKILLAITLC